MLRLDLGFENDVAFLRWRELTTTFKFKLGGYGIGSLEVLVALDMPSLEAPAVPHLSKIANFLVKGGAEFFSFSLLVVIPYKFNDLGNRLV